MKQENRTSLEITETHIKLLQAKGSRGGLTIQACDIRRLSIPSDEETTKILSVLVTQWHLRHQLVIAVIPRRFCILRHLTLPSHDDKEIQKMIGLQIINQVPYSREDIIYDYVIVKKEENGYSKVLIVIVHRDVVQRYLRMLQKVGIHPQKVTVSSLGLLRWWEHVQKKDETTEKLGTALINIDEVDSEICFCFTGHLLFSRHIQLGARELHPEHMDNFFQQIDLTIKSYQKDKMGPEIERFIVISTLAEAALLRDRLSTEYKKNVEIFSPLESLPSSLKTEHMSLWERSGYSIAVGLGIIFSDIGKLLNFVPTELKDSKMIALSRRKWLKLGTLVTVVIVLCVSILWLDVYKQDFQLSQIQNKVKMLKIEATDAEKKIQLVTFVEESIQKRVIIADIISELYRLTPDDIAFRSLSLTEQGLMTIQGFSKTRTGVNNFQNQLVNSSLFKEVTLQYASRSAMFGKELTDFKITFQLAR